MMRQLPTTGTKQKNKTICTQGFGSQALIMIISNGIERIRMSAILLAISLEKRITGKRKFTTPKMKSIVALKMSFTALVVIIEIRRLLAVQYVLPTNWFFSHVSKQIFFTIWSRQQIRFCPNSKFSQFNFAIELRDRWPTTLGGTRS